MTKGINTTHDSGQRSWVESANAMTADFPIQNLPFGVFRRSGSSEQFRGGIAIGDQIVDVGGMASHFEGIAREAALECRNPTLAELAGLGNDAVSALRGAIFNLLRIQNDFGRQLLESDLVPQADAEMALPFKSRAFTDFFASIHHATNAGRLFRPHQPLLPNYKYVPIAYNGRASTIHISGKPVRRPHGQILNVNEAVPQWLPSRALDYEAELGFFIGVGSTERKPISVRETHRHIFGFCLVNDWSARDIQAWEYQPLGPFLAKSFATTASPWVVTEEALRPFRCPAFERTPDDPPLLPYLDDSEDIACGSFDITIEVSMRSEQMIRQGLSPMQLSRCSARTLYWTVGQMLAHQTSNGCNVETGDLIGSGTISGTELETCGSLLEITKKGEISLPLPTGETRSFLEDGDEVTLYGFCERPGFARIGLGTCVGAVVSASLA